MLFLFVKEPTKVEFALRKNEQSSTTAWCHETDDDISAIYDFHEYKSYP